MRNSIKRLASSILSVISHLVPLDETLIVFESGRGLADDNPRAFYDYLVSTGDTRFKRKFVISRDLIDSGLDSNDIVYLNSIAYFVYMMRAKVLIRSQSLGSLVKIKKDQKYVQLWHGADLKISGYDMLNLKDQLPVSHVREWDYFIANNKDQEINIRNQTGYRKTIQVLGMARTDYLVQNKDNYDKISKLKKQYGISSKIKKIFLYAPTHRDWELENKESDLTALYDIAGMLQDDACLLVRYHPLMRQALDHVTLPANVYNFSNVNNLNHVLLISDVLISDYSSVFYDYSLLDRPIVYYNYDEVDYATYRGGFYYSHAQDLPGILCKNADALKITLNNIDELYKNNEINNKNRVFRETLNYMNDGNVCQRLYDFICSII